VEWPPYRAAMTLFRRPTQAIYPHPIRSPLQLTFGLKFGHIQRLAVTIQLDPAVGVAY
jgi:hypothetical protein